LPSSANTGATRRQQQQQRDDSGIELDSPSQRIRLYNMGIETGLPIPVRPCALISCGGQQQQEMRNKKLESPG
jgi:hypothetical protein